ncbi:MAG TPA: sigma-54 dependent transcriptional regulator [Vicinamibacterales bacterium]|nr:sigma-54 dependent transcriptional regulator [Vicinamibacterales bacterium]HOQ61510.1 sigma-54 dependent transcriptional regulator [Vicinamibacterales bacterium]
MTMMTTNETSAPNAPRSGRILVVDDERSMRELLQIVLRREGHQVRLAEDGPAAVAELGREPADVLISDIRMPGMSGVDVLREAKRLDPDIVGIMVTAYASTDSAVEALRLGAYDYLTKPFDVEELKAKVRNALERRTLRQENVLLKRALRSSSSFSNIVGRSRVMQDVFDLVETVAPTNSTILIMGESGTGKELVARAVHTNSLRRDQPFVALNCGALPEALLESELFGHMRGAFTGAAATKKGLLEVAERGTVFLDEISEMSPMMQVKLLRVLQERRFRRVGGNEEIDADIRIIAATNRDLARAVADGTFREDLYYRVNVIPIHLPPLRERREDIAPLAEHFVAKYREQMGKAVSGLTPEAVRWLEAGDWPGNVRQLENVIERAVALERGPLIQIASLPAGPAPRPPSKQGANGALAGAALPEAGLDLPRHLESQERDLVAQALQQAGGRHDRAARLLAITPRQLRYLLDKHALR